jgi:hypothetical protein
LRNEEQRREDIWSQSLAVGSAEFVQQAQRTLGRQGRNRALTECGGESVLRDPEESYGPIFGVENRPIRSKNMHLLDVSCWVSRC